MGGFQERKKYIHLENVINKINQKYISLPANDVARNRKILKHVVEQLIFKMKKKDALFKKMFERTFYGGSFYDGLKVGKPEEYDLDFVLNLPLISNPQVVVSDRHGFVFVRIMNYEKVLNMLHMGKYKALVTLMDDNKYMCTKKVLWWMEKLIALALNEFKNDDGKCYFDISFDNETIKVYVSLIKAFPAYTLNIKNDNGSIYLDIDLVTCFQFSDKHWPGPPYKSNCVFTRNNFLVVPKKPHAIDKCSFPERYWRLSFQEQERELLKGAQYKTVKPCIRLLKKLRDKQNHKIASYFIKTVFLWEIDKRQNDRFWDQSLSYVFMKMLEIYSEMIENKNIPYYWNPQFNLISHLKSKTCCDIAKRLTHVIQDINKELEDPFVIAKFLVHPPEVDILREEVQLSKKFRRKRNLEQKFPL